jgi:hypothetical protein
MNDGITRPYLATGSSGFYIMGRATTGKTTKAGGLMRYCRVCDRPLSNRTNMTLHRECVVIHERGGR